MDKIIPIVAFSSLDNGKCFPDPRSIVQIALSDYRDSSISNERLAEHICCSLAQMIMDYDLRIGCREKKYHLSFEDNKG